MQLNRNNFLRWNGAFKPAKVTNLAFDKTCPTPLTTANLSVSFNPIYGDISTIGIDTGSFELLTQSTATISAPVWDGVSSLTIYAPLDNTITQISYSYRWFDLAGNVSSIGALTVNVIISNTEWVAYSPSYVCRLNSLGQQYGVAGWNQIVLAYTATGLPVMPLTLANNDGSVAPLISDQTDIINCAGGAVYAPIKIMNLCNRTTSYNPNPALAGLPGQGGYIVITNIQITYSNNPFNGLPTPFVSTYATNILPSQSQTLNVIATLTGTCTITLSYNVMGGGSNSAGLPGDCSGAVPASHVLDPSINLALNDGYFWYYQSGAGSPQQDDSFVPSGGSETYENVTIPYAAGCSLYIT